MAATGLDLSEVPKAVALQSPGRPRYRRSDSRLTADSDVAGDQPVPVTIITGFLGAGKTSLVNSILTEEHGFRVAVILNDFGEQTGIEKAVLQDEDNAAFALQDIIELSNGCLCCSVKSDFVAALEGLMQQRSRFDYVLIETTGLADPGPVAAALWTDAELQASVCLDAVVTVVDARNIEGQLARTPREGAVNEAQQQIAYADVVLLNKVDLVPEAARRQALTAAIRQLNASAEVHETTRCHLHLEHILGRGILHNPAPLGEADGAATVQEAAPQEAAGAGPFKAGSIGAKEALAARGFAGDTAVHVHDSGVGSCTLHAGLIDLDRLKAWLDELLWEDSAAKKDIFRMKGGVAVAGSEKQHMLQAVQDLYEVTPGPAWPEDATQATKIVVIGRGLNQAMLQAGLDGCRAQ